VGGLNPGANEAHYVRTDRGTDDKPYHATFQVEDDNRIDRIFLTKDLNNVAGE
ncbi:hypothetical protein KI387_041482, partial [Taxus chinensis]